MLFNQIKNEQFSTKNAHRYNKIKPNYFPYFKFKLRRDMEKRGLAPSSRIITDGESQLYSVNINGTLRTALYTAISAGRRSKWARFNLFLWIS